MYSTAEERTTPSRFRLHDTSTTPPTVGQIAMGLHVSRTPHLRPTHRSHHTRPPSPGSQSNLTQEYHEHSHPHYHDDGPNRRMVDQPPKHSHTQSSQKSATPDTPGLSVASTTTITSTAPSTPSTRSVISLKRRMMSRLLPGGRDASAAEKEKERKKEMPPPPLPRKAVRFSEEEDQALRTSHG
jgi:hypothetical protein